jgi:hypothetical protein
MGGICISRAGSIVMSTLPDNEFDLEKLFLPAWAQEAPSAAKYAKFEGEVERPDRRGDHRGPRPPRPDGRFGGRRPGGPQRPGAPGGADAGGPPQGDRRREGQRGPRGDWHGKGRGDRRLEPRPHREPPPPLPEIQVAVIPDEKGVESLARQIKISGRAYPLFDIAQMILQKPERHGFTFSIKKNAEGKPIQPLFLCALDDTLWLSENEAVGHVLNKHFSTFYQAERTATEPPKGKYTFVAQCGISGVILGPPNHHDYQSQLRKLHAERFSRMPFEVYKARVKIVRDEEVVKKWVDDQSWKTEYLCLNMPEALRLASMEAVEKHFRENHKDNILKAVETHASSGQAARSFRSPELNRLVRSSWEDQRRFPLQIATVLSQQFASHGLQFFKVDRTITHVSVARPHYLDLDLIPISDGVKKIVDFINTHSKGTRRQLLEALAPAPAAPAPVPVPVAEGSTPAPVEPTGPTPEQTAVIADLHWLIHQGHVIEFANGILETAKKPLPKPPKPQTKTEARPTPGATTAAVPAENVAAQEPGAAAEAAPAPDLPARGEPAAVAPEAPLAATDIPAPAPAPAAEPTPAATSGPTVSPEDPSSVPAQDNVAPPALTVNSTS